MKIILTESQYKNLFESKEEKKSDLLYGMWMGGMSIDDIKDYTGMNIPQIISYLKNKEIKIDCKFAENLVLILMFRTDFINKNYNFNDGQMFLNLSSGGFSGTVEFEFNDKNCRLNGMATPYWNGDCDTPVDGSSFEDKRTGYYNEYYDNTNKKIENTPSSFNSIQELIDFLNDDYPKQLIKPIKKLIEYYLTFTNS
jgi:hypothetical protein